MWQKILRNCCFILLLLAVSFLYRAPDALPVREVPRGHRAHWRPRWLRWSRRKRRLSLVRYVLMCLCLRVLVHLLVHLLVLMHLLVLVHVSVVCYNVVPTSHVLMMLKGEHTLFANAPNISLSFCLCVLRLHHAKFECNYGVPLIDFDRLFGTWYVSFFLPTLYFHTSSCAWKQLAYFTSIC